MPNDAARARTEKDPSMVLPRKEDGVASSLMRLTFSAGPMPDCKINQVRPTSRQEIKSSTEAYCQSSPRKPRMRVMR